MTREQLDALSLKADRMQRMLEMVFEKISEVEGFENETTLIAAVSGMAAEVSQALDMPFAAPPAGNVVNFPLH